MIQNASLFASRLALLLVLLSMASSGYAQFGYNAKKTDLDNFLKTQWWLGIKVGTNFSQADPKTRYTSINPIDYEIDSLDKSYSNFSLPGVQIGLDISFYHKGISFGIQPTFKQMRYEYSSDLAWAGDTNVERFETSYDVEQRLNYLELPVSVKYEPIQSGKVRPFVSGGVYYSFILGAEKKTQVTHTDYITGTPREFDGDNLSNDVKNQFKNYFGVLGGIGSSFDFLEVRTVLEINYLYALSTVTKTSTRFEATELTALGEVNDKVNLNNLSISLSFVFPLRFIDTTFQSR